MIHPLLLLFFGFFLSASAAEPIRLRPEPVPFTPKEFYVAAVTDQRSDKDVVARLVLTANQPAQPVDLDYGLTNGIQRFIDQSVKQNRSLRPVAMRIRQCRISEKASGSRVNGQYVFTAAFELLGKDDSGDPTSTFLFEYRGGVNYARPLGQTTVVETAIRQSLTSALRQFNDYMNKESGQNEKLAKRLEIKFTDDSRITNDDTVHYNPDRKLTWADFRSAPRQGSHYAAEVFTSFAYEGKSSVKNGVIQLNLTVKAYMLKEQSWGRADAKNAYALNHEQRHFDITKIITERFKHKIGAERLTLEDYNSIAQYEFIESYRELNKMQKQYDDETNHSINQAAQERWNQKIDAELQRYGLLK